MISNVFYEKKVIEKLVNNKTKNETIYEEEFVQYLIASKLWKMDYFSKEDVLKALWNFYGKELIKPNAINTFCANKFNYIEKKGFQLLADQAIGVEKVEKFKNKLNEYKTLTEGELYHFINENIRKTDCDIEETLKYVTLLDMLNNNYQNKEICYFNYYTIVKDSRKIYRDIYFKIKDIDEFFDKLEIAEIINNELQLKILFSNNINIIKDLKQVSINSIICIFSNDLKEIEKILKETGIKHQQLEEEIISGISKKLKPNEKIVIEKRYNHNEEQKRLSLEETGNLIGITRQRTKQLEKNAINKILSYKENFKILSYCLYKNLIKEDELYVNEEEFSKSINNKELLQYLLLILELKELDITYDNEFKIIYNQKNTSIEEISKENLRPMENFISEKDLKRLNQIQKTLLEKEYRKNKGNLYIKKGMNLSELYLYQIKETFKNGFRIGSEEDYKLLMQKVEEQYGKLEEIPSMRSIQGMIERAELITKDKGLYIVKEYSVSIPEDLLNEILEFIVENQPTIYYRTIFDKFKIKLEEYGIDNYFYLKGCIDDKLPKEFSTKRDYITISEMDYTPRDMIIDTFKSFESEFSIEDIKEKIPGLNDYTYSNYIYSEKENGLIRIDSKCYIYFDKLKIEKETIEELKKYIENMFIQFDTKILSSRKIYAKLRISNQELFDKLHLKRGHFELFSIINYLYKDYFYSRPFISKEKITKTTDMLIKEYAQSLEMFNHEKIQNYIQRMNIGGLYSYLTFMEDMSDDYVQINIDTMIRKDKFKITNEQIQRIEKLIDLILDNYKCISTENFNGYAMLPKLETPWNKYLLIGIIRSFLDEKFQVENTVNSYNKTEFIIRRI